MRKALVVAVILAVGTVAAADVSTKRVRKLERVVAAQGEQLSNIQQSLGRAEQRVAELENSVTELKTQTRALQIRTQLLNSATGEYSGSVDPLRIVAPDGCDGKAAAWTYPAFTSKKRLYC